MIEESRRESIEESRREQCLDLSPCHSQRWVTLFQPQELPEGGEGIPGLAKGLSAALSLDIFELTHALHGQSWTLMDSLAFRWGEGYMIGSYN